MIEFFQQATAAVVGYFLADPPTFPWWSVFAVCFAGLTVLTLATLAELAVQTLRDKLKGNT